MLTAAYVGLSEARLAHVLRQGRQRAAALDRADRAAGRP